MSDTTGKQHQVAVLLPCYNEAATISEVVESFRRVLPNAAIYVYDNNSTDGTALKAMLAGARVFRERRQGKGHVVRRMFSDIEADIYVMADGDGTYRPEDAEELIRTLLAERADMVVGTRRGVHADAGRNGHAFGNRQFNRLFRFLFGNDFTDILSGYRAFSRRFVKSFPAVSNGFEIETEMSVHASRLKLPVCEIELDYGRRPEGSHSKLSTFRDGFRILFMFAMLMKETRPFVFFGSFSAALLAMSVAFMTPVLYAYALTGLVDRMPTWVFSMSLMLMSLLFLTIGLILDSLARSRADQLRIRYMSLPALGSESSTPGEQRKPEAPRTRARRKTAA